MKRQWPNAKETVITWNSTCFKATFALQILLGLTFGSVGLWLCITSITLYKSENISLDVKIHPFNYTNHDRSISGAEKPHVEELEPREFTIIAKKENLTHSEEGYDSFTYTKYVKEEPPLAYPQIIRALEMLTEPVTTLMKDGNILEVNNSDKFGPYTGECNKVQGSDGFLFPPPLTNDENLYDPVAKQAVPLVQINSTEDTTYYEPNKSYLATEEYYPENACYANRQAEVEDPKDGIRFIGNNIIITQPHFLDGDPRLLDNVEGLVPDKKKHGIQYTVDTKTGETLKSRFTFQFNIQHKRTILPILWIEVNYARDEPYYVIPYTFWLGVVLIILMMVFLGTSVITGSFIQKTSDTQDERVKELESQLEKIIPSKKVPTIVRVPNISNTTTALNSDESTAAATSSGSAATTSNNSDEALLDFEKPKITGAALTDEQSYTSAGFQW